MIRSQYLENSKIFSFTFQCEYLYVGREMQGVGKVRLLEIAFEEARGARTCFVAKVIGYHANVGDIALI